LKKKPERNLDHYLKCKKDLDQGIIAPGNPVGTKRLLFKGERERGEGEFGWYTKADMGSRAGGKEGGKTRFPPLKGSPVQRGGGKKTEI